METSHRAVGYLLEGLSLFYQDDLELLSRSLELIDRAVAEAPDHGPIRQKASEAYFLLGTNFFPGTNLSDVDEAIASFRRVVDLRPDNAEAHNNLGNALASQGKLDEAIHHYRRAVAVVPTFSRAHYKLGNALAMRGDIEGAIFHFRRAVEIMRTDFDAHFNLGSALRIQGNLDEAISHFQEALRLRPDHKEARENLEMARKLRAPRSVR